MKDAMRNNMKRIESGKWMLFDYIGVREKVKGMWEVDDKCFIVDEIVLDEKAVNDDIVSLLIMYDCLKQGTNVEDLVIFWEDSFIELYQKEDGRPLCCLMKY